MSGRIELEVVAQVGGAPDAVMCVSHVAPGKHGRAAWTGNFYELRAFNRASRLLPMGSIFDAKLSSRWGCLVACTPEFSAWWRARRDRPTGFFLNFCHE